MPLLSQKWAIKRSQKNKKTKLKKSQIDIQLK